MNPFETALKQLDRAAALGEIDPDVMAQLRVPEREVQVSIPVRMDDGSLKLFHGYRVEHNSARGPYKGGLRYHQNVDIDEVRALALWMTMKCAVAGIPMGGGKGGVTVDPKELSPSERENLTRSFACRLAPILGPDKDVPAPDVNTNAQDMDWIAEEYAKYIGQPTPAVITGKSLEAGGSLGRNVATAKGGFDVFEALAQTLGLGKNLAVIIQGFGNAGQHAARFWSEAGHRVVGLSDSRGAILNPDGIDIDAAIAHKTEHHTLEGLPGTQTVSNEQLLVTECDLLIPAALENQITEKNAKDIKARVVLELANGPTTTAADDILFERSVVVVPDILANAGGVTVSTYEWEQNLKGETWSEEEVLGKLKEQIQKQALAVFAKAEKHQTDLRRGAFLLALDRIQEAMQ